MDNNLRKWTESFIKHAAAKSAADDYAAVKDVLSSGSMLTNPLVGGGIGAALGGGVGAAINQFLGDPATRKKLLLKRVLTGAILGAGLGSMPGGIMLSSAMPSSITPSGSETDNKSSANNVYVTDATHSTPTIEQLPSNVSGPPVPPTKGIDINSIEDPLKRRYAKFLLKRGQTNMASHITTDDVERAVQIGEAGSARARTIADIGTPIGTLGNIARGWSSRWRPGNTGTRLGQLLGVASDATDVYNMADMITKKRHTSNDPVDQILDKIYNTSAVVKNMPGVVGDTIVTRGAQKPAYPDSAMKNFGAGFMSGSAPLALAEKLTGLYTGDSKDYSGTAGTGLGTYMTWKPWIDPVAKGLWRTGGRAAARGLYSGGKALARPLAAKAAPLAGSIGRILSPLAVKALPYVAPAIPAADAMAALGVTGMFGQDAKSKADALVDFKLRTVYDPTWISQHPFRTALSLPLTAITPSTGVAAAKKVFGGEGANRAQFSEAMKGDIANTQRIGQWLRSLPVEKRIEVTRAKPQLKSIFNQHLSGLQPRTNIPWWAYLPFGAQAWDPNKLVKAPGR